MDVFMRKQDATVTILSEMYLIVILGLITN